MSFHIHKRSYYRYNKLVCPDKLLITIKTTGLKPSSVFCIYLNTLCPCKTMLNSKSIKLMVPSLVHTALPQLLVPHLRLTLIHNSYCTISMFQADSKLLPTCLRRDSQALGVLATQTLEASQQTHEQQKHFFCDVLSHCSESTSTVTLSLLPHSEQVMKLYWFISYYGTDLGSGHIQQNSQYIQRHRKNIHIISPLRLLQKST